MAEEFKTLWRNAENNIFPGFFPRRCLQYTEDRRKSQQLQRCLEKAEAVCRTYGTVAVKTIRLSMAAAEQLLARNPALALIFLVRDPRACVWSRMNVFGRPRDGDLRPYARAYCTRLRADLDLARHLFSRQPARLRFIRY